MSTSSDSHNNYPDDRTKDTFLHEDLKIQHCAYWQKHEKPKPEEHLLFGHHFSDHMVEIDWTEKRGWKAPMIIPLKELHLHPGAKVFHYAVQMFDGMKAFRGVDGKIRLFRPEMNIARMRRTAHRAVLPDFDGDELLKIICELVRVDKEWVPYANLSSLYIRPSLIGTDPVLGLGHSRNAKLFVLTGPVSAYYDTGFRPISLFADSSYVRACRGGVGSFKMGCNYAPTLKVGKVAVDYGCQQVLWLSDFDQKFTEVGAMNIFVYWINENGESELVTPPLEDGLILPGITRDSALALAREWDEFKVSERYPTMEETKKAVAEGRMLQIFGTGTACAVSPVERIVHRDENDGIEEIEIPTMTSGADLMQRLYEAIVGIQYGQIDRPEWIRIVAS